MTAATQTLPAWLLDQIAEDEAPTFELVPYDCPPGCCAPAGFVGHRCLICGTPAEFGGTVEAITAIAREHEAKVHQRARVLAECEAKRHIVESRPVAVGHTWDMIRAWHDTALRALALPYADRPGYDETWRP